MYVHIYTLKDACISAKAERWSLRGELIEKFVLHLLESKPHSY